jgi:hypothetical protein
MRALMILPYSWIYQHYRLVEYAPHHGWWMGLLATVWCDFCTYW